MYDYLQGVVSSKSPTRCVVEVGGVGYECAISMATHAELPEPGEEVQLLTHLVSSEAGMRLYGFLSDSERVTFRRLIAISGIGPGTALSVLSGVRVEEFRSAVVEEDVAALQRIRGVGPKTARRIVVELQDVFQAEVGEEKPEELRGRDAVSALQVLGVMRGEAERLVRRAAAKLGSGASVEQLVRHSLAGGR